MAKGRVLTGGPFDKEGSERTIAVARCVSKSRSGRGECEGIGILDTVRGARPVACQWPCEDFKVALLAAIGLVVDDRRTLPQHLETRSTAS
jgi:hypothetical protein